MKCIRAIKNVLLDKESGLLRNIFSNDEVCQLGVTFLSQGRKFSYDFWHNAKTGEYVYESFAEKIVEFIKNEDLYMDDFKYVDGDKIQVDSGDEAGRPEEKALDIPENIMDQIRLVSTLIGLD